MSLIKRLWVLCALCVAGIGSALAQPLEDVTLEYQSGGIVATIHLNAPVRYLRHFPAGNGQTMEIFYERVQGVVVDEPWLKRAPSQECE